MQVRDANISESVSERMRIRVKKRQEIQEPTYLICNVFMRHLCLLKVIMVSTTNPTRQHYVLSSSQVKLDFTVVGRSVGML